MGVVHVVVCNYLDDGGVAERAFSAYSDADEYVTKREVETADIEGITFDIETLTVY